MSVTEITDWIFISAALYGVWLLWSRLRFNQPLMDSTQAWPKVSVIVPARNEESNIGKLLNSLEQLEYPDFEILVIDDQSDDDTAAIVQSHRGVTLIAGQDRPTHWSGKQWACHQAVECATGDYLLFTDADTIHPKNSLSLAINYMQSRRVDMLSAIPFHHRTEAWDALLGPFQVLLLLVTAPFARPKAKRLFAIGQYLLFRREVYLAIHGHAAVKDRVAEDLALAKNVVKQGYSYAVYPGLHLFEVKMYESFAAFVEGWRRNFRLGMRESSPSSFLDVLAVISALIGAGQFLRFPLILLPMFVSLLILAFRQKQLGEFSVWGVVLLPYSLFCFCLVTSLALFDQLTGRSLRWKGRLYSLD